MSGFIPVAYVLIGLAIAAYVDAHKRIDPALFALITYSWLLAVPLYKLAAALSIRGPFQLGQT